MDEKNARFPYQRLVPREEKLSRQKYSIHLTFFPYLSPKEENWRGGKERGKKRRGQERRVLTENSRISIQGIYRSYMYMFPSAFFFFFLRKGCGSKIMAPKVSASSSTEPQNTLPYVAKGTLIMRLWVWPPRRADFLDYLGRPHLIT